MTILLLKENIIGYKFKLTLDVNQKNIIFVVNITFRNRKDQLVYNDDRIRNKVYGKTRADIIKRRLAQLHFASSLEDVRHMPGNYHELKGIRKGQWACDLDQPYRLVFSPLKNPIPSNEHGQFIWIEIKEIEVIEIVNYHKER